MTSRVDVKIITAKNNCCGDGVLLAFLVLMRYSLQFFCGVAVFRHSTSLPCPPLTPEFGCAHKISSAISEYRSWEIWVRIRFCKKELDKFKKTSQINPSPIFMARFQSWALPLQLKPGARLTKELRNLPREAVSSDSHFLMCAGEFWWGIRLARTWG